MPNSYSNLLFHVVFSTKQRRPLISTTWRGELDRYIGGIVREKRGTLLEIGGMPDHLHLALRLRADTAVANMVRDIKANSSRWIREREPELDFHWQDGYGAFSVSKSQFGSVIDYIRTQEEHHRPIRFEDEFRLLLERHEIEYDPKYLFD